jgi:hypothetical protein
MVVKEKDYQGGGLTDLTAFIRWEICCVGGG